MRCLLKLILVVALHLHLNWACKDAKLPDPSLDWWQWAQLYQIYPRSFKDSNGDGIGDLKGVMSKLDYLKSIGVNGILLSSIYKSPMADFGYDISDFFDIQPEYGTLEDFDNLIYECKSLGIKVIMDFVPNHSSDENEWFKKSVQREPAYENYYVWHDGYKDKKGRRVPPSNWLSQFRGSAWEWNEERQQYYLHQFSKKQPDFNYRSPELVAQMHGVLTYWLDRGVDGFRVDAVEYCFEVAPDYNGRYPDEPLSGTTYDRKNSEYLKHIYTKDQSETIDMVYQWRKLLIDYARKHGGVTRVLLTESSSPLNYTMQLYGNSTKQGAHIPFNFQFINGGNTDRKNNAKLPAPGFVNIINSWMNNMPDGKTPNWVMGNHDQRRVGSRYGEKRIDLMNMLQMFLPGVSITYMGEEIGMTDFELSWKDSRDPAACNSNPKIYKEFTRDPSRTPFQWSEGESAGFSTNSKTWLPINPNYVHVNLEEQKLSFKSHFTIYNKLSVLRKEKTLQMGGLKYGAIGSNILAIQRFLKNETTYILLANVLDTDVTADVTKLLKVTGKFKTIISNMISTRKAGDIVNVNNILLKAYEAIIVKSIEVFI